MKTPITRRHSPAVNVLCIVAGYCLHRAVDLLFAVGAVAAVALVTMIVLDVIVPLGQLLAAR